MANVISNVFKQELLKGSHDFDGGATYKIALYTSSKTATASDPTAYNTTNEQANTGTYAAGGGTLANAAVTGGSSATTAFVDFDDISFTSATITARYAQIYRSDGSAPTNNSVCMLDFGGDFSTTSGTFTIQFPSAGTSTAILRLS
jgi:hypothetical protein|tara:strand:+ start:679 stop:1116 length:438 start_codon:yes stop_codon:yes gene_type:complete